MSRGMPACPDFSKNVRNGPHRLENVASGLFVAFARLVGEVDDGAADDHRAVRREPSQRLDSGEHRWPPTGAAGESTSIRGRGGRLTGYSHIPARTGRPR